MRRSVLLVTIVAAMVYLAPPGKAFGAGAPVFTLDDNPAAPAFVPGPIPGYGAEEPFGRKGTNRVSFPGLAPSPSLGPPPVPPAPPGLADSDLLSPGPVLHVSSPAAAWINAISGNTQTTTLPIYLNFSVDRVSAGLAGTAVSWQAGLNQQPGDVFQTTQLFPDPGQYVGLGGAGYVGALGHLPVGPGGNILVVDESQLGLLTANGIKGPAQQGGTIVKGSHDNVDGFEWKALDLTGDQVTDRDLYFSVNPDEAIPTMSNVSPADLFHVPPGVGGILPVPFASAATLGLKAGVPMFDSDGWYWNEADDVDALVMWDEGIAGKLEPGVDYALFSLSPGSASLGQDSVPGLPASRPLDSADIFFTDFTGSFALFAGTGSLGLKAGAPGADDNVDALEVSPVPEPLTMLGASLGIAGLIGYIRKRCGS